MKLCSKCNETKPYTDFYKRKKSKDGYNGQCKPCVAGYESEYRLDNLEISRERARNSYLKRKDKVKTYIAENKDRISTYMKEYNAKEENKVRRRKLRRLEYQEKYKNDIQFTISLSVRNRIKAALKLNVKKSTSAELLGCNIQEYKLYLEGMFDENMSWDNYGTYWEIDHIKQLCTFDLSLYENQLKAFNYKNTRPLSLKENRSRPRPSNR